MADQGAGNRGQSLWELGVLEGDIMNGEQIERIKAERKAAQGREGRANQPRHQYSENVDLDQELEDFKDLEFSSSASAAEEVAQDNEDVGQILNLDDLEMLMRQNNVPNQHPRMATKMPLLGPGNDSVVASISTDNEHRKDMDANDANDSDDSDDIDDGEWANLQAGKGMKGAMPSLDTQMHAEVRSREEIYAEIDAATQGLKSLRLDTDEDLALAIETANKQIDQSVSALLSYHQQQMEAVERGRLEQAESQAKLDEVGIRIKTELHRRQEHHTKLRFFLLNMALINRKLEKILVEIEIKTHGLLIEFSFGSKLTKIHAEYRDACVDELSKGSEQRCLSANTQRLQALIADRAFKIRAKREFLGVYKDFHPMAEALARFCETVKPEFLELDTVFHEINTWQMVNPGLDDVEAVYQYIVDAGLLSFRRMYCFWNVQHGPPFPFESGWLTGLKDWWLGFTFNASTNPYKEKYCPLTTIYTQGFMNKLKVWLETGQFSLYAGAHVDQLAGFFSQLPDGLLGSASFESCKQVKLWLKRHLHDVLRDHVRAIDSAAGLLLLLHCVSESKNSFAGMQARNSLCSAGIDLYVSSRKLAPFVKDLEIDNILQMDFLERIFLNEYATRDLDEPAVQEIELILKATPVAHKTNTSSFVSQLQSKLANLAPNDSNLAAKLTACLNVQ